MAKITVVIDVPSVPADVAAETGRAVAPEVRRLVAAQHDAAFTYVVSASAEDSDPEDLKPVADAEENQRRSADGQRAAVLAAQAIPAITRPAKPVEPEPEVVPEPEVEPDTRTDVVAEPDTLATPVAEPEPQA